MKKIAVIFGGRSAEHDISIVTALGSIIKPLEISNKFKVLPIYIAKNGAWYHDEKLKDITLFTTGQIESLLDKTKPVSVRFDGGMSLERSSFGRSSSTRIDVVFPAMHGTYGEDGSLMGLLEMAGVPYVGCPLAASVVAMDKVLAKQIAAVNNIPVTKYEYIHSQDLADIEIDQLKKILNFPVFVKPAHLGSSIGITRATDADELKNGLEVAAHYDDKILIEEEVANLIEVTLPILGNNELKPALLERPLTSAEDFFDFDTKYLQGGKGKKGGKKGASKGAQGYSELPAKLPEGVYDKAEKIAIDSYRALGCKGTARVDLLIDGKSKKVYFNEVNPLPGSLYAHNWRASGVTSVDLVTTLVKLAEEQFEQKQKANTAFSTNYLKQF